jgi:hypothetical protein
MVHLFQDMPRYEIRFTISESMTPVLGIGAISIIDKKNVTPKGGEIALYIRSSDNLLFEHRV